MRTVFLAPLCWCARWGRLVLVGGLLIGIAFPDLAQYMRNYLPHMLVVLLFLAALRIGPAAAFGRPERVVPLLGLIGLFQILLPCLLALAFLGLGWTGALPMALVLMASASPISGSPNLTAMVGGDPAPSLRLLVMATALLPATVVPVFAVSGLFGSPEAVFDAAMRLLLIIVLSSAAAFVVRWISLPELSSHQTQAIDGASSLMMAVLVVALMSAFGPALLNTPLVLAGVLALAFSVNVGLQVAGYFGLAGVVEPTERIACAIGAGNRNMALFLAALPATLTDPLLLYVACYQIPMYLTPYVLGWLYGRHTVRHEGTGTKSR